MINISRSEFNQTVLNYSQVYLACSKDYWLEEEKHTKTYFSALTLIKMMDGKVQGIPLKEINITSLRCQKKLTSIELDLAIKSIKDINKITLPWDLRKLPTPKYLLTFLYWLDPGHSVFKSPEQNFGIEETIIQIKKDTWEKLKQQPTNSKARALLVKRTQSERKEVSIAQIDQKAKKLKIKADYYKKVQEEQEKRYKYYSQKKKEMAEAQKMQEEKFIQYPQQ